MKDEERKEENRAQKETTESVETTHKETTVFSLALNKSSFKHMKPLQSLLLHHMFCPAKFSY